MTVTVPAEIADALKREARRQGCSVSALARDAFGNHLHMTVEPDQRRHVGFAALGRSGEPDIAQRAEELLAEGWGERDRRRGG